MVIENLKQMLQSYNPNMPWYFGCKLKPIEGLQHGYMSGGAGYVLSKKALKRFVTKASILNKIDSKIGKFQMQEKSSGLGPGIEMLGMDQVCPDIVKFTRHKTCHFWN